MPVAEVEFKESKDPIQFEHKDVALDTTKSKVIKNAGTPGKESELGSIDEMVTGDANRDSINYSVIEKSHADRMKERQNRKRYMLYPEDEIKGQWDVFITLVLLFTCITTPARIAFDNDDDIEVGWETTRWIVDFFFLVDIIINFNSAYQDDDFKTIEDRKRIALDYIFGWFLLDIFAIIPFTELAQIGKKDQSAEG